MWIHLCMWKTIVSFHAGVTTVDEMSPKYDIQYWTVASTRGSRVCGRGRERFCYRESIVFPEPTTTGINTGFSTSIGKFGNSCATTTNNSASFAYVSIPSVMLSNHHSVHSSEAVSISCFDVPSRTLSNTIREQSHLCHDLIETKTKLRTPEQDAANFDI